MNLELRDQVPVEAAGLPGFGVHQQAAAADGLAEAGDSGDHIQQQGRTETLAFGPPPGGPARRWAGGSGSCQGLIRRWGNKGRGPRQQPRQPGQAAGRAAVDPLPLLLGACIKHELLAIGQHPLGRQPPLREQDRSPWGLTSGRPQIGEDPSKPRRGEPQISGGQPSVSPGVTAQAVLLEELGTAPMPVRSTQGGSLLKLPAGRILGDVMEHQTGDGCQAFAGVLSAVALRILAAEGFHLVDQGVQIQKQEMGIDPPAIDLQGHLIVLVHSQMLVSASGSGGSSSASRSRTRLWRRSTRSALTGLKCSELRLMSR